MNKHLIPIAALEHCNSFQDLERCLRNAGTIKSDVIHDLRKNVLLAAMSSQTCNEWESVSCMLDQCRVMGRQRGGFTIYFFCRKTGGVVEVFPLVDVSEVGETLKVSRCVRSSVTNVFYYLKGYRKHLDIVKQRGMVIKLIAIYRDGNNGDIHEN